MMRVDMATVDAIWRRDICRTDDDDVKCVVFILAYFSKWKKLEKKNWIIESEQVNHYLRWGNKRTDFFPVSECTKNSTECWKIWQSKFGQKKRVSFIWPIRLHHYLPNTVFIFRRSGANWCSRNYRETSPSSIHLQFIFCFSSFLLRFQISRQMQLWKKYSWLSLWCSANQFVSTDVLVFVPIRNCRHLAFPLSPISCAQSGVRLSWRRREQNRIAKLVLLSRLADAAQSGLLPRRPRVSTAVTANSKYGRS